MKRVLLALVGAFTIVATGPAYAAEPFSFGIKGGLVNSMITGLGKTKHTDTKETSTFNLGGKVGIYGEYAFHENVGVGLEADYIYATVGKLANKDGQKHVTLNMQKISVLPSLIYYPMGREEEDGILKLFVGGDISVLPLKAGITTTANTTATDVKTDITAYGLGVRAGVGYEFPFGLTLDLDGGYSFTDLFNKDAKVKVGTDIAQFNIANTESTNLFTASFSVGYNFGVLLQEQI